MNIALSLAKLLLYEFQKSRLIFIIIFVSAFILFNAIPMKYIPLLLHSLLHITFEFQGFKDVQEVVIELFGISLVGAEVIITKLLFLNTDNFFILVCVVILYLLFYLFHQLFGFILSLLLLVRLTIIIRKTFQ